MKTKRQFIKSSGGRRLLFMMIFLAVPLALSNNIVYAQGGTTCAAAACLTGPGTYTAVTDGYVQQWYKYTPTSNGTLTVQSCGYTSIDTYVRLYNACGGTQLTYNDDYCPWQSRIDYAVTAGVDYYIDWDPYWEAGTFQWSLSGPTASCSSMGVNPGSLDFGYTPVGQTSPASSYVLTGVGLTPSSGNITVAVTGPFEISLSSTTGFGTVPLSVPYTGGTIAGTTIYARFKPTAAGVWAGNISNTGGGVATKNVTLAGTTTYSPCIPQFYDYNLGSIVNVTFGSINNTTPYVYSYPPYFDYSSSIPPAGVVPNQTYNLSVTWNASTSYSANCYAYFDWNNNAILDDPGEVYFVGALYTSGNVPKTGTIAVTVPATALAPRTTRMRIRVWNSGTPGPCGIQYGEVEDYSINIISFNAPKIELTPTKMQFYAEANMSTLPAAQNLQIKNVGANVAMNWSATTSSAPAPNWLSAGPPTSGVLAGYGSLVTTPVRPNRTNLAASLPFTAYTGYVNISSPDANNSPQQDTAWYYITPANHIDIGNPNIVMKVLYKHPVMPKKVVVSNTGGMFNGGQMNWSVTTTTPWISFVGPTSGLQGASFQIMVNPGASTPGTLNGSITITAFNGATGTPADNSPLTIPVVMEIEPDQNYSNTTNVNVPGTYYFNNSFNQRVMDLTLNSGSLGSFTVNMFPGQVPNGLSRLRYVWRYFTFGTTASPYNVNMSLYYTSSEQFLGGVTKPELLTVWRQYPSGGSWVNKGGTSDPLNNKVTVNGITDLSGNWLLASPWYPKRITLTELKAVCIGDKDVAVEWKSNLRMNQEGFVVQRAPVNADDWTTVSAVPSDLSGSYRIEDRNIMKGTYQYQIIGIDKDGNEIESQVAILSVGEIPQEFTLGQNYPNPFNPSTTISFGIPENGNVRLEVYNLVGSKIATIIEGKELAAGNHTVSFNASTLESGTYIYRLTWNGYQLSKRLSIMR